MKKKHFGRRFSSLLLAIVMILTLIPGIPIRSYAEGNSEKVSITMHFQSEDAWEQVCTKIAEGESWSAIPGYVYANSWPGAAVEEDSQNAGWYSFTIIMNIGEQFNCIFNNGNNGKQTENICFKPDQSKVEKWVIQKSETQISNSAPENWKASTSNAPVDPNANSKFKSPVVNSDRTVTFQLDATGAYKDASDVRLMGTVGGTDWTTGLPMEKDGDVFRVTTGVQNPGIYEYKFKCDADWITDPLNGEIINNNSKLVVPGLAGQSETVKAGEKTALPQTLKLYAADGSVSDESVTYQLKDSSLEKKVTLEDGNILVPAGSGLTQVELTATAGSETAIVTVQVVEKMYTYNIYFYDSNEAHMSTDAADIWMWENKGGNLPVGKFTELVTMEDGNQWLKATVTTSATDIGFIPRSAGEWKWQTANFNYNNKDKQDEVSLYVVNGDETVYTELPEIKEARKRYVVVEYDRPADDYDGWNIYSWNSGFGSETEIYSKEINGKHTMIIPVKDSKADFTLGFCMRRTEEDNAWAEKDGGNHEVVVPADQNVIKVKFEQGKGITETLPMNKGYEMKGSDSEISFFYRDDMLLTENKESSLNGKVKVVVNGTAHEMTYDEKNERYTYQMTGCETGEYTYYYIVDGERKTDLYNANKKTVDGEEVSYFTFKKFSDLSIHAALNEKKMNYNDNNVLSVSFAGNDAKSFTAEEIDSITADLSALGLGTMQIHPELMKLTISATSDTSVGDKNIPVTMTDIYGNVYQTTVSVTVTARDKDSFDWDEAVIYMTCTDRFFDGNTENDKAYHTTDVYDPDGSLSYHGGDFAGLEQKLDYLDSLGVNTIWITPIVDNSDTTTKKDNETIPSTGYHGYWASDFTSLNPHLGTEEEFSELIDAVHAHGMKLMVDVVLNHAGYDTEDTFNNVLIDQDGNAVPMIRDSSNSITGDDVYASLAGLPDFVTENSEVRDQLVEWQTDWVKKYDIDYYRVDTVKHVDSVTWAAFKNALTEADADFKMIGEYSGAGYASTAGELGTGSMDSLLDFDFNDEAQKFVTGNLSEVESFLEKRNSSINNTATLGAFLSSHDEDSLVDKLINDNGMTEEEALKVFKVAASLQLTSKGQAVIYYGEEIGQHGLDNYPYQTNRYDFDWTEEAKQEKDDNSMLNHYKKLLSIREANSLLLARGTRTDIQTSDEEGYSIFERSYQGDTLTIGLNISEGAKEVTFHTDYAAGTILKDLYGGSSYTVGKDQNVTVTIPSAENGGTVILSKVTSESTDPTPAVPAGGKDTKSEGTKEETKEEIPTVASETKTETETVETPDTVSGTVSATDWDAVVSAIKGAADGETITVVMDEKGILSSRAIEALKGTSKKLILDMGNGIKWIIDGKNIEKVPTSDIHMKVKLGSDAISDAVIKASDLGENVEKILTFSLEHDGEFGFMPTLSLEIGKEYAGKYANLFYYNPKTKKLEGKTSVKIAEDGTVEFTFRHASDYLISVTENAVMSENKMVPDTGDTQNGEAYLLLIALGAVAIVAAGYQKKKAGMR